MAHVTGDRIKETSTTTGTGTITLAGAVAKFLAVSSAATANGDTFDYSIVHQSAVEWEVGVGTRLTATTFSRAPVASSNAGAAVNFSAGTKDVFLTLVAARSAPKIKIAVLGGSAASQFALFDDMWPVKLGTRLFTSGVNAEVRSFGIGGHSCYRMLTGTEFDGGSSSVAAIAWKPDVVLISAGHNDCVANVDSRTYVQKQGDADTLFANLRAGLPSAVIILMQEIGYDDVNFDPAVSMKNKGVIPLYMQKKTSGILQDCWTSEILEDAVSAGTLALYLDLKNWVTYTASNANLDAAVQLKWWKLARLGLLGMDHLHFNQAGHVWAAALILKALKNSTAFTNRVGSVAVHFVDAWNDPDVAFAEYLTASGDGWAPVSPYPQSTASSNVESINYQWGQQRIIRPEEWYLPTKARFNLYSNTGLTAMKNSALPEGMLFIQLMNGPPNEALYVSIDGGAWTANVNTTNSTGCLVEGSALGTIGLPNGTYTLRYRCRDEVYGPFSITMGAASAVGGLAILYFQYGVAGVVAEYDNGSLGATPAITWTNGQKQKGTLTANATLTMVFTNAPIGHYQLRLIQDGTGGWTITWSTGTPGTTRWLNLASAPTINGAISGETIITLYWDGTNATGSCAKVGAT